jgi:hypothetical protein
MKAGRITWKGPGRSSRKAAPVASLEQERSPVWRRAESLLPNCRPKGMAAGCGPLRRLGSARSKGRGDPLKMKAKALRTVGPVVRARRFGALEGGAPSTWESESHPGRRAPGRGAKILRDRWTVGPLCSANAGTGAWQNCPAAKASRIAEALAIECESVSMGDGRRIGFAKVESDSIRRRRGAIPGGCVASGNGAELHHPSDGRNQALTRATELEPRTHIPIPVCAGTAARRPAKVVNGIWNRAGTSLSGERMEPEPNSAKR